MYRFCPNCAAEYADDSWPRVCRNCEFIVYQNQIPVSVGIIPVRGAQPRVVVVERGRGNPGWALPGGFVDKGETWQEALVREAHEEAGIVVPASSVKFHSIRNAGPSLLVFGITEPIDEQKFVPDNNEVISVDVLAADDAREIVFPLHRQAKDHYFDTLPEWP